MSKRINIESITDLKTIKGKVYKYIKVPETSKVKLFKDESEPIEVSSSDLKKLFTGKFALYYVGDENYTLVEIADGPENSLELWAYAVINIGTSNISVYDANGEILPETAEVTLMDMTVLSITLNDITVKANLQTGEVTDGYDTLYDILYDDPKMFRIVIYKKVKEPIMSFNTLIDYIISNINPSNITVEYTDPSTNTIEIHTDNDVTISGKIPGIIKGSDNKSYTALASGPMNRNVHIYEGVVEIP